MEDETRQQSWYDGLQWFQIVRIEEQVHRMYSQERRRISQRKLGRGFANHEPRIPQEMRVNSKFIYSKKYSNNSLKLINNLLFILSKFYAHWKVSFYFN